MLCHDKPTKAQLIAAKGRTVPDLIKPELNVLFCGINPGLYSGAVGHHFARPGNRFWTALHAAGFTHRVLSPCEERELLKEGYGITNVVKRATAGADELSVEELAEGGRRLERTVRRYRPRFVAVLGVGAYQKAFGRPKAAPGRQHETIHGSTLWVLPNPSGLNAHYQLKDLTRMFRTLRIATSSGR